MPREKSCGAIVFRKEAGKNLFLLLHYDAGHWDFPKGHVEENETDEQVVKREVLEETGITTVQFVPGFKERIQYFYKSKGQTIFKEVFFYLLESAGKKVKLSFEHKGFAWLQFKEAYERVTYKNAKEILRKANDFLKQQRLG